MSLERLQNRVEKQLPNIVIVPFTSDFKENYIIWFNDPFVRRHLHPDTVRTPEGIEKWMNSAIANEKKAYRIITHNGKPIGHAALWFEDEQRREGALNLVIGDREVLTERAGIAAGAAAISHFFREYLTLEGISAMRYKGITGEKIFPAVGFKKIDEEGGDEFDVYRISREKWQELVVRVPQL